MESKIGNAHLFTHEGHQELAETEGMFVREVVVIPQLAETKAEVSTQPAQSKEVTKPTSSEPVVAPSAATVFESRHVYHLQTNE